MPAPPPPLVAPDAGRGGLPITGERTVPGVWHENYWLRRHEIAYLAVAPLVRGGVVLEAGAGEGYGAARLALVAGSVLAVDYDAMAIRHLAGRYRGRIRALRANLVALPLRDESVDSVVSLQVIEHLWDQSGFLAECARVLKPGGLLAISTPNRLTFTPPGSPANPFHSRELTAAELSGLLSEHFALSTLAGVHHRWRLRLADRRFGGLVDAQLRTAPGQWSDGLRRRITAVRAADFAISRRRLDESLDLLALARKR